MTSQFIAFIHRINNIIFQNIACKRPLCNVNVTNTLFINYANNAMRCLVGHETTIISGRIEPSAKMQYFTEMATDRYPISGGILNSLWTIPVRIRGEAAPKFTCVSPSRCPSTFRVTRVSSRSSEISDLLLPDLLSRRYRIYYSFSSLKSRDTIFLICLWISKTPFVTVSFRYSRDNQGNFIHAQKTNFYLNNWNVCLHIVSFFSSSCPDCITRLVRSKFRERSSCCFILR